MSRITAWVIVALATTGCSDSLTQTWQLTDFRILGIKADPPEVGRGETAQLTLVVADPLSRPVQVYWRACTQIVPLSTDAGAPSGCETINTQGGAGPDLSTSVMLQVPTSGGEIGAGGNENLTILGFACAGGTIGAPMGGALEPTCTSVTGAAASGWQFTRTFNVHSSTATDPINRNPSIAAVRFGLRGNSTPIDIDHPPTIPTCADAVNNSAQCQTWGFEIDFSGDSREIFHRPELSDGGVTYVLGTERLTVGYVTDRGTLAGAFRTDSDVDPMATMENDYFAPSTSGDSHVYIYAVDGRGGFDWTERVIRVQ